MTKLTDTQCLLFSIAAKRGGLSLYPLPEGLEPKGGLAKAISPLSERCLIAESETCAPAKVYRTDADYRLGLFVTRAGLTAIGIDRGGEAAVAPEINVTVPKAERVFKTSAVLDLLRREGRRVRYLILLAAEATDLNAVPDQLVIKGLPRKL